MLLTLLGDDLRQVAEAEVVGDEGDDRRDQHRQALLDRGGEAADVAGEDVGDAVHHRLDEREDLGGVLEDPLEDAVDRLERLEDRAGGVEQQR